MSGERYAVNVSGPTFSVYGIMVVFCVNPPSEPVTLMLYGPGVAPLTAVKLICAVHVLPAVGGSEQEAYEPSAEPQLFPVPSHTCTPGDGVYPVPLPKENVNVVGLA